MKEQSTRREKDDFWDISSLVPPRPKAIKKPPVTRDTSAVEILSAPRDEAKPYRVEDAVLTEHYVRPPTREAKPTPLSVYTPTDSLLHEVRVYAWGQRYEYYERFRAHARGLYKKEGEACECVPFFSYMPQYEQMSTAQLAYYLWWRTNFRKQVYLEAEYSYLLLYLYELINLCDVMPPREVQDAMLRLWTNYRRHDPRLDASVREWLCDHALLYQLDAPVLPRREVSDMIGGARLKEYYVPLGGNGEALVDAVLFFCNNYDYTKSKFFTEETAKDYHRVLRGALAVAIDYLRERDGNVLTGGGGVSTVSRDAFSGAICSYQLKRRIEVDYTSFSHTHELRYIMSDVLKYAENGLRATRGVKSRLSVYAIEVPLRERLDAYLALALPQKTRAAKQEEVPAYERRYDLPVREVSPKRAAEIEAASWQTTKRLVEAFEEETPLDGVNFEEVKPQTSKNETAEVVETPVEGLAATLGELCTLVRLLADENVTGARAFARECGRMLDALVDRVNEAAVDALGDIIIEDTGEGFALVEEYREQLTSEGVL